MKGKSFNPAPSVIDGLYWLEGLTQQEIARRYDVDLRTIGAFMKRCCIPSRPAGARPVAQCVQCKKPVCYRKVYWKGHGGYRWRPTTRCLIHQIIRDREQRRAQDRRRRGYRRSYGAYRTASKPALLREM